MHRRNVIERSAQQYGTSEAPATTKADELARTLEEMIVCGRLQPGRLLRQEDLSRQFGVSRTPVREAFRKLAALGLVSFIPNRGVRVRALDKEEWGQAFLARAGLESAATYRAAQRVSPAQLARIDEANEQFRAQTEVLRSDGLTGEQREQASFAWNAANDAFHDAILDAADTPIIGRLISGLRRVFSGESLWWPGSAADRLYECNLRQHDAIRFALAAGNANAACTLAFDHILDSWELLKAVLADAPQLAKQLGTTSSQAHELSTPILSGSTGLGQDASGIVSAPDQGAKRPRSRAWSGDAAL